VAKIEVFLQDDRGSQRVYWIERRQAIVGWFTAARILNGHVGAPADCPLDLHFTYPVDGDYHFSLKDQGLANGNELFESVFCDRVRRKSIIRGVRTDSETPRNGADSGWDALMDSSRPPRLGDYSTEPIVFQFPLAAIPVRDGRVASPALDRLPRSTTVSSRTQPICVSEFKDGVINVCAYLLGKGSNSASLVDEHNIVWIAHDDLHFPRIHVCVHFYPE
jgi:hypothetical protein